MSEVVSNDSSPENTRLAFAFEPLTLLLGVVFVTIAISAMGKAYYRPYESLVEGLALLAISFLPVFHLQTKEQVSDGWLWVVFGTMAIISGLRSHRVLVGNLAPNEAEQDHA